MCCMWKNFHVIIIRLFLSWSCPLRRVALSVVFSVNFLPQCCVSFCVSSSVSVHVKSQHFSDAYELAVAKTSLSLYMVGLFYVQLQPQWVHNLRFYEIVNSILKGQFTQIKTKHTPSLFSAVFSHADVLFSFVWVLSYQSVKFLPPLQCNGGEWNLVCVKCFHRDHFLQKKVVPV